jgi:hypothetical protein
VSNPLDPSGSIISKAAVDVDVDVQFMAISAVGDIMSVVATWAILHKALSSNCSSQALIALHLTVLLYERPKPLLTVGIVLLGTK